MSDEDVVYVIWAPQYHDMGLITYLKQLVSGSHLYGMSALSFIQDPLLWPRAMQRYNANCTAAPNFAYALTCRRLRASNEVCFIPTMIAAAFGGEPSDLSLIPEIESLMGIPRSTLCNTYGIAENTLTVAAFGLLEPHADGRWAVGNMAISEECLGEDGMILVVDISSDDVTKFEIATPGQPGEIWIAGRTVAAGYWGKPELTKQTFYATLKLHSGVKFLRTGDLGYISRGELVLSSRLKDLIIVAGKNIAPTNIEYCVQKAFKELRPGSIVAVQPVSEKEEVILVAEIREGAKKKVMLDRLAAQISNYIQNEIGVTMHRVLLLRKGQVPKTTSGKVQRNKVGKMWLAGDFKMLNTYAGDSSATATRAQSLKELFTQVGVEEWEASLEENGIDSLRLTKLIETARTRFSVVIEYADASGISAKELFDIVSAKHAAQGTTVFVPPATPTTEPAGPVQRVLGQLFVLVVLLAAVFGASVPSAYIAETYWDDDSWFWISNGRMGPILGVLIIVWMITYTALCILAKWVLIGSQRDGMVLERGTFAFARWWTVHRLFAVWEVFVGIYLLDTIAINVVYKLLGANVSMTCRIKSHFREWDLVSIGSHSVVSAMIYPRFFTAQRTVVFGAVTIGSSVMLGDGSAVNVGASIDSGTVVDNGSLVDAYVEVPKGKWHGIPGQHIEEFELSDVKLTRVSWVSMCMRMLVPIVFACTTIAMSFGINMSVPSSPVSAHQTVWTVESATMLFEFLYVFAGTGFGMLAVCLLLKWSFVAPYLTDKMVKHTHRIFFPYIFKNFLAIWWFRLFGMPISTKAKALLCPTSTVSESLAHLITIEQDAVVVLPLCEPQVPENTANTIWQWLFSCGRRGSPWSAKPDIVIPSGFEAGYFTRFESGCLIESNSATMVYSRLTSRTKVPSGKLAMGNPTSFLLSRQGKPPKTLSLSVYLLQVTLTVAMLVYMTGAVYVTIETVRSQPIYKWTRLEARVPVSFGVAVLLLQSLLLLQVVAFKVIVMGKTKEGSFPANGAYSILVLQSQLLEFLLGQSYEPFYNGLIPVNLYYRVLGGKVDWTTSLLCGTRTPADLDLMTFHSWCVIDCRGGCSSHLMAQGQMVFNKVEMYDNAVVHPRAYLINSTIGSGGMLRSLSCTPKRIHVADGEHWIGAPASCARVAIHTMVEEVLASGSSSEKVGSGVQKHPDRQIFQEKTATWCSQHELDELDVFLDNIVAANLMTCPSEMQVIAVVQGVADIPEIMSFAVIEELITKPCPVNSIVQDFRTVLEKRPHMKAVAAKSCVAYIGDMMPDFDVVRKALSIVMFMDTWLGHFLDDDQDVEPAGMPLWNGTVLPSFLDKLQEHYVTNEGDWFDTIKTGMVVRSCLVDDYENKMLQINILAACLADKDKDNAHAGAVLADCCGGVGLRERGQGSIDLIDIYVACVFCIGVCTTLDQTMLALAALWSPCLLRKYTSLHGLGQARSKSLLVTMAGTVTPYEQLFEVEETSTGMFRNGFHQGEVSLRLGSLTALTSKMVTTLLPKNRGRAVMENSVKRFVFQEDKDDSMSMFSQCRRTIIAGRIILGQTDEQIKGDNALMCDTWEGAWDVSGASDANGVYHGQVDAGTVVVVVVVV
eukprot:scaffold99901_cov35-Attheya_sp.AAC.1